MDEHGRFIALIRESAAAYEPELPQLPAEWEDLQTPAQKNYRAVLFDVYGTLFCSAAGDIAAAGHDTGSAASESLLDKAAGLYEPGLSGGELRRFFIRKVDEIHRQLSAYSTSPEVQADEIWLEFLRQRGLSGSGQELALRYELAVNPVCPMPGADQVIAALRKTGCVLGIISNAQFYTPLLFEAFFGGRPEEIGFDRELIFYSFEYGEAKPSPRMFEAAAGRLMGREINPGDCAFVGNDMLSDIYGAKNSGFQGVLFAGDKRSLRLHTSDERLKGLRPDRIIRSLCELGACRSC